MVSKMNAHAIITAIEQTSSDLAQVEKMLRQEDQVIAGTLCKLIGRIFWGMQRPLIDDCPSLSSLAVVGEKYKKCICRIVEYDRGAQKCNVIKSAIPAEEANRVLAEISSKTHENADLSYTLEVEHCSSPDDDVVGTLHQESEKSVSPGWQYRCRIESKARAALIVKKLEKVSSDLGRQAFMLNENKKMAGIINQTLGDILTDVYYPILRVYPSLLPSGLAKKNSTYRVVEHHWDSGANFVKKSGILSQNANDVLAETENGIPARQDFFFYLELEEN
ncbi:MAG: hypothetical protein AB7F32_08410 [Victivallaceae bacterium]